MHVSQLAGNNLHVTSGPRRQLTCWAAPWRSFPLPSSSINPRATCPEPAPAARLLKKMAQQMQVLNGTHLPMYSFFFHSSEPYMHLSAALFLFVILTLLSSHSHTHTSAHHLREIAWKGESKAYLSNEYYTFYNGY